MEKEPFPTVRSNDQEKRTLYETYTDYIDPSSITINHYLSKKFYAGQQNYIEKIKQWIQSEPAVNKPLVFKTSPGVGVKTILSRWYRQTLNENENKKYKILPIIHFASNGGNSSNYFYCLYRIVIKLRQALKIKQGVDLLQQKIRKYFAYWLDTCSTQIEKQQILLSTQQIYSKIVIVIEGVDKFLDQETGKEANIAFWLPETFPKNVKVICTVSQQSQSLEHFEKKECPIEQIYTAQNLVHEMLTKSLKIQTIHQKSIQSQLKRILEQRVRKIKSNSDVYKFIQIYTQFLLIQNGFIKNQQATNFIKNTIKNKISLSNLSKLTKAGELYDLILNLYCENAPFKKKLSEILMYFALSQKGITIREIIQLTRFTEQEWILFYSMFSPVLIKHQSIYSIKCSSFIECVMKKDKGAKQNKQSYLIKYHQKIAQALENTPNSIRKLEQETYHLFVSKSYFKLKEMVSSIENFLLMFNPNNKYQLSRYWQKLQEKGFDPVIEYNKAIQGFSMHYHPSDQNIFKIIVQISRFLKEFCDFQTYETPSFRHPLIQGNMAELQKIGLLEQFTELEIYVDNSFSQLDEPQNIPNCDLQQQIRLVRQQYFPKDKPALQLDDIQSCELVKQIVKKQVMGIQKGNKKIKKKINTQILSQIQKLNVDVPLSRQKFRSHYLNTLQQFMKNEDYNLSKQQQGYFQVEDDNIPSDAKKLNKSRAEFSVNKIKENYKMRHIKPSLYYYKRWIWIQFPWVCISLNNNYSNAPEFCKQLECQDIDSYEQEAKYTKQALIVAIQAKQKKKMMFTKKGSDAFNGTGYGSRMRNPTCSSGKYSGSARKHDKSTMRSRIIPNAFSNIDLNLNALTKELQSRKKYLPIDYKGNSIENDFQNTTNDGIFLSQINENCQDDMKFINQRKHFEAPETNGLPSNEVLPKLKWTIKDHTNYEINYIKSHIEQKKKKLNKIIFENKKLAEVYKQLKLKQNLTKKNMIQQDTDKNSRKSKQLQEYAQKKQDVINQFCKSLLQKQRLKIILKLCAENKTRNQQYLAALNYFLQNLKKMISWQKNNIKEITTQMNGIKSMKQKKQMMEAEKQRNAKIVEKQIKNYLEEKDKLQQQIQNISCIIAEDLKDQKDRLENNLEGHLKNKQEKNMLMMQEKKTKQLQQKLKSLQQEYQGLKKLFDLDGTDFQKSPKFQHLLEQNEKNKKLKIIYFERKNKLQQAQKQYEKTKQVYEKAKIQRKNEQNSKQLNSKVFKQQINPKKLQTQIKNTNSLKILLSNIALKLGAKTNQQIVPILKQKLQELKLTNPLKYHQIMNKSCLKPNNLATCPN